MVEYLAPYADRLPADYTAFLTDLKARIAAARTRAALAVNSELIADSCCAPVAAGP